MLSIGRDVLLQYSSPLVIDPSCIHKKRAAIALGQERNWLIRFTDLVQDGMLRITQAEVEMQIHARN